MSDGGCVNKLHAKVGNNGVTERLVDDLGQLRNLDVSENSNAKQPDE
jgi:hypothetical protein